jgi:hypothetical protein
MLQYLKFLLFLPNLLTWVMNKLGVKPSVQQVILHVAVVFTSAFVAQLVGASLGAFDWPTLSALLVSAAASGGSAVFHYILGMVPTAQAKALSK